MASVSSLSPPITESVPHDLLESAFSFLSWEDRLFVVPLVCKKFHQILVEDTLSREERAYARKSYTLFDRRSQRNIIELFGVKTIANCPVIPWHEHDPNADFNKMREQGSRIAVAITEDNRQKHAIMISFERYEECRQLFDRLFLLRGNGTPEQDREVKKRQMEAVAEVIATSQNPIVASPEGSGLLVFKNEYFVHLSPIRS